MSGFLNDPMDRINTIVNNLRDLYPRESILKELLQNADDAGAKELDFGWSPGLPHTRAR